jgi:hypothetical protein
VEKAAMVVLEVKVARAAVAEMEVAEAAVKTRLTEHEAAMVVMAVAEVMADAEQTVAAYCCFIKI